MSFFSTSLDFSVYTKYYTLSDWTFTDKKVDIEESNWTFADENWTLVVKKWILKVDIRRWKSGKLKIFN